MKCSKVITLCASLLIMSSVYAQKIEDEVAVEGQAQMVEELQEVRQVEALVRTGALNRDQSVASIGSVGGAQMKSVKLGKCSSAGSYTTSGCAPTTASAPTKPKEVLDIEDTKNYDLEQGSVKIQEAAVRVP